MVLDAPYQRPSVWTIAQRQNLVRSWLSGIPVPAVIVNNRWDGPWGPDRGYAVVDGKQRLETAVAWFEGELAVPASWFQPADYTETTATGDGPYVTYNQLSDARRRLLSNRAQLPMLEAHLDSLRAEAELYDLVNTGGTNQRDEDIDRARAVARTE
jgi:hypothetical protein